MKQKIIVCLSGGLDSTVLLAKLHKREQYDIHTASFFYGSKHNPRENRAAAKIAEHYGTAHSQIDLSGAFRGIQSHLMAGGGVIPHGHYEEEAMRLIVVPGRNTIFAAVLLGLAESIGAAAVCVGIHAGDHHIYPDCRAGWWGAMTEVYRRASEDKVSFNAPFISIDKREIVHVGIEHDAPFAMTRTCYSYDEVACGRCGSCIERREAFALNGAEDPLPYAYNGPLPKRSG